MQNYEVKNYEVLDILEKIRYTYTDKYHLPDIMNAYGIGVNPYYYSDEYRDKVIRMGTSHDGAAAFGHSYPVKAHHLKKFSKAYEREWQLIDTELRLLLGLDCCALAQYYPPDGHIEWHNNANASAYNLIFTWSETGDGWFKWYDLKKKENVTMPDKKGWSLKAGYFGGYDEPDKVVYHAAHTNCPRLTVSYVLGHNYDYWKDVLEVIGSN